MDESFRQREKSYEAKFKLDEERRFKAESRRNKLLGLWAAEKMGLPQTERDAYALSVINADFKEPGHDDVIRKIKKDFDARSIKIGTDEIREELTRLYGIALEQISKEYPQPLG